MKKYLRIKGLYHSGEWLEGVYPLMRGYQGIWGRDYGTVIIRVNRRTRVVKIPDTNLIELVSKPVAEVTSVSADVSAQAHWLQWA